MKKVIILTILLTLGGFILINYKGYNAPITNITISCADPSIPEPNKVIESYGLVDIISLPTVISIELRYACTDNFAGKEFYPKIAKAYLLKSTAEKLVSANEEFYKQGYRLKIYDAYRPYPYQRPLRDAAAEINPKTQNYIADPHYGSNHNRGASVDVTLTDFDGKEIPMPTKYDHFGKEASITYSGATKEEIKNRELLGTIMEKHGFKRISSEWWHFDDVDCLKYPLLSVDFVDLASM